MSENTNRKNVVQHDQGCSALTTGYDALCTCYIHRWDPSEAMKNVRDSAYQDFVHGLQNRLHELFMCVNDEMGKHSISSREWQEMYIVSVTLTSASNSVRLAHDRSVNYRKAPF